MTLTLDHIVVGADTLEQGRAWARSVLGVEPISGGRHVFMGTHNLVLRLDDPERESYLEILAIDPDAPSPAWRRWFDLDDAVVRDALAVGPRLIAWVARSDDLDVDRQRFVAVGADPGPVHAAQRATLTGTLRWRITIREDGQRLAGGAMPALIAWDTPSPASALPPSGVSLERLAVRGVAADVAVMFGEAGAEVQEGSRPLVEVVLAGAWKQVELDAI